MKINTLKTLLKGIILLTGLLGHCIKSVYAASPAPTYTMTTFARPAYPNAIGTDYFGNVYIDSDGVRKYDKATGTNSVITGSGANAVSGAMAIAVVPNPFVSALSATAPHSVYTADQNNRIYKLVYNAQTKTYTHFR